MDFGNFTKTMMDLMVLALACGRSRVLTYVLDRDRSDRIDIPGLPYSPHSVAHGSIVSNEFNPTSRTHYRAQTQWFANQFGYFASKLKTIPTTQGKTLLDSTIAVLSSYSNHTHMGINLPMVIVGRGGGISSGRVLNVANGDNWVPLSNLWVEIANRMGVSISSFGDSTGRINLS